MLQSLGTFRTQHCSLVLQSLGTLRTQHCSLVLQSFGALPVQRLHLFLLLRQRLQCLCVRRARTVLSL